MSRWTDTGELAGKALDYETRGNAAMFALKLKDILMPELEAEITDEARKAKITLAARFINDQVLEPTITGETDPELVAFLSLAHEFAWLKTEAPSLVGDQEPPAQN